MIKEKILNQIERSWPFLIMWGLTIWIDRVKFPEASTLCVFGIAVVIWVSYLKLLEREYDESIYNPLD